MVYPTSKVPNLDWYASLSEKKKVPERCGYASAWRCPRFYQSLSLLGNAGSTRIPEEEESALFQFWKKSDLWPLTAEQSTAVQTSQSGHAVVRFCPEVSYERFGYFATYLSPYSDEIDRDAAHERLANEGAVSDDPRWNWQSSSGQHYTQCPIYAALKQQPSEVVGRMGSNLETVTHVANHLDSEDGEILMRLLGEAASISTGVEKKRFRAEHYKEVNAIDRLVRTRKIREEGQRYFVGLRALIKMDAQAARELLGRTETLFAYLKTQYRVTLDEQIFFSQMAKRTGWDLGVVAQTIAVMIEATQWWVGRSDPEAKAISYIIPSEKLLAFESFASVITQLLEWDRTQSSFPMSAPIEAEAPMKSISKHERPRWLKLLPSEIRDLVEEVYAGLDQGLQGLPAMGLRAVIDMAAVQLVGDQDGFDGKIKKLLSAGHITEKSVPALMAAIDAGHAAAHRGHIPPAENLNAMLDVVEHLLEAAFVLSRHAQMMEESTPKRGNR